MAKKAKMEKDDEERLMDFIEKQVERGKQNIEPVEYTELIRESEDDKIKLELNLALKKVNESKPLTKPPINLLLTKDKNVKKNVKSDGLPPFSNKRKSALDEILEEEEKRKEKKNRKDYWLSVGIVVKIITKSLGDKYYKKKGVIESIKDNYIGDVRMFDTNDLIKIDQEHLETVIPSEGRLVKIVNGAYRGEEAILKEIHEKKFCATLEISSGLLKGRIVQNCKYEDFSKLNSIS